jgi:hypothetical protein
MSLINPCIEPGCSTLCIGLFCIRHDTQPQIEFARGRPWPPPQALRAVVVPVQAQPSLSGAETALAAVNPAA